MLFPKMPNAMYPPKASSDKKAEPIKEMTIAEIEKELGYKIKVIGDKT